MAGPLPSWLPPVPPPTRRPTGRTVGSSSSAVAGSSLGCEATRRRSGRPGLDRADAGGQGLVDLSRNPTTFWDSGPIVPRSTDGFGPAVSVPWVGERTGDQRLPAGVGAARRSR